MLEPCPCSCTLPPGASPPVRPPGAAGLRCGCRGREQGPFSLNELCPLCFVAWGELPNSLGLNFLTCEMGGIRSCFLRCLGVVGVQVGSAGERHGCIQLWTLAREDVPGQRGVDSVGWVRVCSHPNVAGISHHCPQQDASPVARVHPAVCRWNQGHRLEGQRG